MCKQLIFLAVAVPFVFSCCIPDQWEGLQGVAVGEVKDGQPSSVEALYNVSFDAVSKKVFLAGSVLVDDKEFSEIVLQDYALSRQYVVVNSHCTVTQLTDSFPPYCTTPAAKMILSTYFGVGKEKIMVEVYKDVVAGKKVDFTVTKGSCVPVSTYAKTDNQVTFVTYMGINPGISNMTIFNVPKACLHVNSILPHAPHKRTVSFR